MVISIKAYEKSSTYKFIRDTIDVTAPLNKLGVKYFLYAELTGCYYITKVYIQIIKLLLRVFIKYANK